MRAFPSPSRKIYVKVSDDCIETRTMENIDLETAIPVGLALVIVVGSFLMMFTNFWTTKKR